VGRRQSHPATAEGARLPRYLGTRDVARFEELPASCQGEGSVGHQLNRATNIECRPGTCFNTHVTTQTFPLTRTGASPIEGTGLFAVHDIEPGTPIIECVGEVLDFPAFMRSMGLKVKSQQLASFWTLSLRPHLTMDGSTFHNDAVYANHSCDPNSKLVPRLVNGFRRLILVALRVIPRDGEITYNYQLCLLCHQCPRCFRKAPSAANSRITTICSSSSTRSPSGIRLSHRA